MKTSSENGSDCNTALAREIKSILVVLLNVLTIVLICAFCNTLSSMAASFCFSYMEIWGYRRILGCSVKLWAIWLSSITLLKSLYSAQFLYLVIYLIKGILQFKKWSPGNEEKVTVFLSSQLGRKVLIFFFFTQQEKFILRTVIVCFFSQWKCCEIVTHEIPDNHRAAPPLDVPPYPLFTWSCCGIPHCKVLLRNCTDSEGLNPSLMCCA